MPVLLTIIAIALFFVAALSLFPQVSEHRALQAAGFFLAGLALIVLGYGGR